MGIQQASLITVRDLLEQKYKFIIPEYQRGFAWGKAQWEDLWNDAQTFVDRSITADHFSGSLMLRSIDEKVEVVDGQQRLTSISLLLRALGAPVLDIEFQNNEPLQTYFNYYARGDQSIDARLGQHRSFYARNVQDAAKFFEGKVQNLPSDQHKKLVQVLLDRFKMFMLTLSPEFNVHVTFETINNRGRDLSILEKLKNRLIYLCSTTADQAVGSRVADRVHSTWKTIYYWLGKGDTLLDDDEFLRAHADGWFRKEKRAEWLTTQLFDEEFHLSANISPEKIEEYITNLEQLSAWWYYLNHPDELPSEIERMLNDWQRASSFSTRPLLLWALWRAAQNAPSPDVISDPKKYGHAWLEPFKELVLQAERFSVLVLLGNERQANVGQSAFNRLSYLLGHPDETVNDGFSADAPKTPGAAVSYVAAYVKALIDSQPDEEGQFPDARFPWEGFFTTAKMITAITERLQNNGFYSWLFGKLIINGWEENLRGESGRPVKKSWEKFSWDDSVEHVYPQTPIDGWENSIAIDGRTSPRVKNAMLGSIGNLLLLSCPLNARAKNYLYTRNDDPRKDKREIYKSGSYSEWQISVICPSWNAATIAARGIAMMRYAQRRWQFELVKEDEKLTRWLPILFGDAAEKLAGIHGGAIDGRVLNPLVERFETIRP
ncbi:DUF262 domain-containing protein [Bordetella sp. FB-8]|uniref:DUF262 domain-containing protein n=1 Tax=Bordetella sp. FB-8 TaxID=1159870 RepID=UPI0003A37CCE|nr:DUF262 domain-containing protein [Bordetella sp. FB-8]